MKTPAATLFTLLVLALSNHSAHACAACYGDTSGSKMGNAAAVGIGAMVIIMFVMLGSIFAVGRHLVWRSKNPLPDYDELLGENGASTPPASPGEND